ncbi:MAG: M23 family metallopeptidase, partial [Sphingobacteriia bacterium]
MAKKQAYTWPVPGSLGISSHFGRRESPFTGKIEAHTGIDIRATTGTPVLAAQAGTVVLAGDIRDDYGNQVLVKGIDGLYVRYAHLSAISVKKGQTVYKNQQIGKVGSTGRSTGPHLHFEVRRDRYYLLTNALDPMEFLVVDR